MAEKIDVAGASVPALSQTVRSSLVELIDSVELARRLQVPDSWVRNRTRARTPATERIPCLRFGRYVRFAWDSPSLQAWIRGRMS
jgi:hypothetical protein